MATVANPGIPGGAIDLRIAEKHADYPFKPNGQPSLMMSSSASSAVASLPRTFNGDEVVRIYNTGSVAVRIKFGRQAVGDPVATVADKAIAPGSIELMRVNPWTDRVSVISASAGTIEFDCGFGI